MEATAAARLASQLKAQQKSICQHVAARLLRAFPEITGSLRLEENYSAMDRLSQVSVERMSELVRSVLLFELPSLVDTEIEWAQGVLPNRGVTFQQQSSMVRWFFEEVRRLALSPAELELTYQIEQHFLQVVTNAYRHI